MKQFAFCQVNLTCGTECSGMYLAFQKIVKCCLLFIIILEVPKKISQLLLCPLFHIKCNKVTVVNNAQMSPYFLKHLLQMHLYMYDSLSRNLSKSLYKFVLVLKEGLHISTNNI